MITSSPRGTSFAELASSAKRLGVEATGIQVNREALRTIDIPAVVWWNGNHFVALLGIDDNLAEVRDPNSKATARMDLDEVIKHSGGVLLTLRRIGARR